MDQVSHGRLWVALTRQRWLGAYDAVGVDSLRRPTDDNGDGCMLPEGSVVFLDVNNRAWVV